MIYSKELTSDLIALYGEDVVNCTNERIRNRLEDSVSTIHSLYITSKTPEARERTFKAFRTVKDIDDAFTELYINELDYKV